MAVLISLGGKSGGDGFLIAPLDANYPAELSLATDGGTAMVTIQADPMHNVANLVFSNAGPLSISTVPTIVTVFAQQQSNTRGDTTIQVNDGTTTFDYTLTSIEEPKINFDGRFEARFSTDPIFPNSNPMYTAAADNVVPNNGSGGWTWGLEGETEFAPGSPVPTDLEDTGMGRVIRLNDPIEARPLLHDHLGNPNPSGTVPPVVTTVKSITGKVAMAPDQTFTAGDPLIGQPVNFGPDTYFAGNAGVNTATGNSTRLTGAEEFWDAGREPLGKFEIRLGTGFAPPAIYFRGASQVGAPGSGATGLNQHTRNPDSRPLSILVFNPVTNQFQFPDATQEFADFALDEPADFINKRIDALVHDYQSLYPAPPAAPVPDSAQRRNLRRRIGHLLGFLTPGDPKIAAVQALPVLPDLTGSTGAFKRRILSVSDDLGKIKESYLNGRVDTELHAWPGGSPGASSVVDYLRQFWFFDVEWHAFAFHTDELCGHHHGWVQGNTSMTGNHIGDPHVRTVDGVSYDFQAVGEFTLLRKGAAMELQVRQTPVATANPITDGYSGLTTCVSLNTAFAARLGSHRVAYQPGREGRRLHFYVDGKPAELPKEGIDLDSHRVSIFDANGEIGLRLDYDDGTVVTVTPRFWNAHQVWYMDVGVSNTSAHAGVMGIIPQDDWLPRLRDGSASGPMPASINDRYAALYKTFADSWRVTGKTSLFVYEAGTSTKTFTDRDWPADKPPCKLKPEFQIPGVPVHRGVPLRVAERICSAVTDKDLHANCVFDVATTGDETFAKGYLFAQELRRYGTVVQLKSHVPSSVGTSRRAGVARNEKRRLDDQLAVTATVRPVSPGQPTPTGSVVFFVDGVPLRRPVELDGSGMASVAVGPLKPGEHTIRATYSGGGKHEYHSSTSANLVYVVGRERDQPVKPGDKVPGRPGNIPI